MIRRRSFLKLAGSGGVALVLGANSAGCRLLEDDEVPDQEWSVFLLVEGDGTVRVTVPRAEMGQGVRTSCAMLVAEELDVAWESVVVEQADGHPKYGHQNTGGSMSMRLMWFPLRQAGATARQLFVAAAADRWGVSESECATRDGRVLHGGNSLGYGELLSDALTRTPRTPRLKQRSEFRIIGNSISHIDAPDIVRGAARYGIDVVLPGMKYASIERSPTPRGRIRELDDAVARAVPGVVDVLRLPSVANGMTNESVAVVARDTWSAMRGRQALRVTWEPHPDELQTTNQYRELLDNLIDSPGRVVREEGDAMAVLAASSPDRLLSARYHVPYLAHASLEPPVCVARVNEEGCEVWAPTQNPQWIRGAISGLLEMWPERVKVHATLLGGGFGRKGPPDFALEAVALARQVDYPVQVTWTREDDIRHDFYSPACAQSFNAALGADGLPTALLYRTAFPSIDWSFAPAGREHRRRTLEHGFIQFPWRVPNLRLESIQVGSNLRVGWMRSVFDWFHAWAQNSFVDELAHVAGVDPLEYQLRLLGEPRIVWFADDLPSYRFDSGRLSRVVRRVAEKCGWGSSPPASGTGEGWGLAAHQSFRSYVAMAVRVAIVEGKVRVLEVHGAVDCGLVINPDTVRAQIEGAVAFALTTTLHGEITVDYAMVEQSNFHDYRMLRISEMPRVEVVLVESEELPTGVGEPGVPPVAPAVCNAIFAATGRRIRELPLSKHGLA